MSKEKEEKQEADLEIDAEEIVEEVEKEEPKEKKKGQPSMRILSGEVVEGGFFKYQILTNISIGEIGQTMPIN